MAVERDKAMVFLLNPSIDGSNNSSAYIEFYESKKEGIWPIY